MKKIALLVLVLLFTLSGCGTRSISDSGYRSGGYCGSRSDNPFYKGELSEFGCCGH